MLNSRYPRSQNLHGAKRSLMAVSPRQKSKKSVLISPLKQDMAPALLEIKELSKVFEDQTVLHPLDLVVNAGEFVVIVGPSGSGKSTLLRLIAGLEEASSGKIVMKGRAMLNVPPAKRDMAMVFQDYALYPHLTVYENMAFCLKMRKLKPAMIQARVHQVAETLALTDFLSRKPHSLSGGQKQRVAIGRALVREPKLFLFDEPLSNLDTSLRSQLRLEMKRLHQHSKMTSLYVTHSQEEAMALATRVLVLSEGRVEQLDSPEVIYFKPATLFVAQFMGSYPMNVLQGSIHLEKGCVELTNDIHLPLPKLNPSLSTGTKVCVGIRPEDLQVIVDEEEQDGLKVQEVLVEPMGADVLVRVASGVGTMLIKMSARAKQGRTIKQIRWNRMTAHLFLAQTGERIGGWDAQEKTSCISERE